MEKVKLYLDFDGVILDTIDESYRLMRLENIDIENQERIREFYVKLNWEAFVNEIKEINNSMDAIQKLVNCNKYEVSVLTHVYTLEEAAAKINFIRSKIENINVIPVPKIILKSKIVNPKNAILVDDYGYNVRDWIKNGGVGIKFVKKPENGELRTIFSLEELL